MRRMWKGKHGKTRDIKRQFCGEFSRVKHEAGANFRELRGVQVAVTMVSTEMQTVALEARNEGFFF